MKDDHRKAARKIALPFWTAGGVPLQVSRETLTEWWLEGKLKIILCQRCWKTFLTQKDFAGDPPFHSVCGNKPCIGNTMLHLDPFNDPSHLDLIDAASAARRVASLHGTFWHNETAGAWRVRNQKRHLTGGRQ
jgi:hypothetical protein